MSTKSQIDYRNEKQIRKPMEVHCGLSARDTTDLTFSVAGDVAAKDGNISVTIDHELWDMKALTDLAGEGFPANGSCEWYQPDQAGSEESGKVGIRTTIGGTITLDVTAEKVITAITMAFTGASSGTVTANGNSYPIKRIVVVPVNNKKAITLTVKADADVRVCLASVTPGITLEFNNENLLYCQAVLRSDLSIQNSSWQVSEIEIRAYWPDDISTAISNVGDDVPIWYYAGYAADGEYAEDFSDVRNFYLSEKATMTGNIITIKGEDASAKLEDKKYVSQVVNTTSGNGCYVLYRKMKSVLADCGIKLRSSQRAPEKNASKSTRSLIFTEQTARDTIQDIMNLTHVKNANIEFWPVFVDAGIPKLTWSRPVKKWDIYEEDCGDIVREADRNIGRIKSSNTDYGVKTTVLRSSRLKTLKSQKVKAKSNYRYNCGGYYWYLTVTNARNVSKTAEGIKWTAVKSSKKTKIKAKTNKKYKTGKKKGQPIYKKLTKYLPQCIVKGKKAAVKTDTGGRQITPSAKRPGITMQVDPLALGKVYQTKNNTSYFLYPNYSRLFSRSNLTGSFTWKGDPRMQPRDVFDFHRKDTDAEGNEVVETCTIESITLTHEGGGTKASISYRKGII